MVNDNVLATLGVELNEDGSVTTIKDKVVKRHGYSYSAHESETSAIVGIYVLDYSKEYDTQCIPDTRDNGGYDLGCYLTYMCVPYKLVIPPKTRSAQPRLHMTNVCRFIIDFCHGCEIAGHVAFLDVPDDEHAYGGDNISNCATRRLCDIPGLVTNLYYTGRTGALRILNRILPNRTVHEADELLTQLAAMLEHRADLHFKRDFSVTTFQNGEAIVTNYYATKREEVHGQLPPIRPEDHILAASHLPVTYDPTITDDDLAREILEGWFGEYGSDKWNRGIELGLASMFMLGYDNKGIILNVADGGYGMSALNRLRKAIYGEDTLVNPASGLEGLAKNDILGSAMNVRGYLVDDLPEGPISNAALANIKSLVTGEELDARPFYTQQFVKVGHFALLVNSNHFPELSPREARRNSMQRRVQPYIYHRIFDDARIDNPSDRDARPDLIAKLIADEHAKSCILNWILEAVERVVINRGYTPAAEDIAFRKSNLGEQDAIGEWLDELGGMFGEEWGMPKIFHFSQRDEMVIYPAWHDGSVYSQVLDMASENVRDFKDPFSNEYKCPYPRRLINETSVLYKLYDRYCKETGNKAVLKRQNLKLELERSGYHEIIIRDPWGRKTRVIVPETVDQSAASFAEFRKEQATLHSQRIYRGMSAVQKRATYAKAEAIEEEISVIDDNAKFRQDWAGVEDLCRKTGSERDLLKMEEWPSFNDDVPIDLHLSQDNIDRELFLQVLSIGIRAMKATYNHDNEEVADVR